MIEVAALFVRRDSHYKAMPGVDAYDEDRNALTWRGGVPGIFHPPCRGWGKFKGMCQPVEGELDLARWSMAMVRRFGGVVEHPSSSSLWRESRCLRPGIRDEHGGVLVTLQQGWFGHRAPKDTALYCVGTDLPELPFLYEAAAGRIESMGRAERERTPEPFCALLVHLARSASVRVAA